jgi:hypothetical protein
VALSATHFLKYGRIESSMPVKNGGHKWSVGGQTGSKMAAKNKLF